MQVMAELPQDLLISVLAADAGLQRNSLSCLPPMLHRPALQAIFPSITTASTVKITRRTISKRAAPNLWPLLMNVTHLRQFEAPEFGMGAETMNLLAKKPLYGEITLQSFLV